ncbi:ATP-binding protein [Nakamurella lactea]|uniref:ATP-binding protein n=1 Tax=Nakamurella lactea TaxID=459515 RepID=UPI0005615465|nr:BTAD domain-containing putative transcriptional regulator [Nakamurella lactea]
MASALGVGTASDQRRGWGLQLLGSFAVSVGEVAMPAERWRLRKAKSLVAMIALEPGQRCHRDRVVDRLWPDLEPGAAAKNLHQTLYVARRALADAGAAATGLILIRDDQVMLDDGGPVDVDALRFEAAARDALTAPTEERLLAAADLYTGDLLPEWPDSEWLTARRHALQQTRSEILLKLADSLRPHAPEQALLVLTKMLDSEPLHEGAVRAVMGVLTGLGRRSEALSRYEHLAEGLLEEFGTDPDPRTAALFRELLTAAQDNARPPAAAVPGGPDDTVGSLPTAVTSFVGRERELGDVERLIGHARLLTLTGTGGCGKTRLAVEAARRARSRYPDGVWFVDLAAVRDPRSVADAVAAALGLDPGLAVPSRERALADRLQARRLLLVLDNCEHLLAGCARLVAALLAGERRIDVLATSREPLHTHGEYTLRVPSLALAPPGTDPTDLVRLGRLPSVRLFVERATQVRPDFVLDAANARDVLELCRRLDGIPLALEIAAARTAALEPAEIVARLGDVLSMGGHPTAGITRQQTLRGALEWSHDLLSGPQRILLRRLSVFSGGFTLEAAETVCADSALARGDVLDLLTALVDKSLVTPERAGSGTRYRQLETVRQFGSEQLERAGEVGDLAAAHAGFFLGVAVAHNPERAQGLVIEQPKVLDLEHDNLRAALRWAGAHDPVTALRLAASLWRFWFVRGHAVEGARWLESALAAAPEPTRARAAALIGLTGLDSRQGRADRHRRLGAEALTIVRQLGDPDEVMMARIIEATLAWSTFDLDEAELLATDLRVAAIDGGRSEYAAAGSWLLGQCAMFREDGALAVRHFESALDELACSDGAARPFLPVVTSCLQLAPISGRLVPYVGETMLLGRRVGVAQAIGYALSAVGDARRMSGDLPSAIVVAGEAARRFADLGDDLARAQVLNQVGCLHRDDGDYRAAEEALSQARELRLELGDRRGLLLTELNLALLHALGGDRTRGLADARKSLSGFDSVGDPVGVGASLTALAAIALLSDETRAARELYSQAAETVAPWRRFAGWLRLMVAELSAELDDPRRTAREIDSTAAIFDPMRCVIAGRRLDLLRRQTRGTAD